MNEKLILMLIDDDADDIQLFADSVAEIDPQISCITFTSGLKAIDYLKDIDTQIPDYIFLDLRMPKMSGQKCIAEIKKIDRVKNIPVFVYTTSRNENDIQELTEAGSVMFITKPTNPEEIYYLVSSIIGEEWR